MVMKSQKKRLEIQKREKLVGKKSHSDLGKSIINEACRLMNAQHKNLATLETLVHAYEHTPADKGTKGQKKQDEIDQNEDV